MVDHTTRSFDAELKALTNKILEMGRLDDEQIAKAIEALLKHDTGLSKRVIVNDDQIDALQQEIEEKAITTIARRQPVAIDLREIVGALRISNDLERIGDLAENIAKRTMILTVDGSHIPEAMLQLQHMAQLARDQIRQALQSYERRDATEAIRVWHKDQEIDAFHTSLFRQLLTHMMEDPRNITFGTHMLFCAKNIERMGDHATNIAETVHHIVYGRPIPTERPKADITSKQMLPYSA